MIKSLSYWEKEALDKVYDLTIVGGGFVGMSAAIHYQQIFPDKSILLLERGVIAYGASTRNAGFSCFGSIGELEDDILYSSLDQVKATVQMRHRGLQKLQKLIPAAMMDYKQSGSIELFDSEDQFEKAYATLNHWNDQFAELEEGDIFRKVQVDQGDFYQYGISNPYEGQLNPYKALKHLEQLAIQLGVHISYAAQVDAWLEQGSIMEISTKVGLKYRSKRIILATNAFTKRLIPEIDLMPARNQVLITEEIEDLAWKGCFHVDRGYIYFRNVGKRLLLGGARNISQNESVDSYGNTEEIQQYLLNYLKNRILNGRMVKIDHWWSGILGVGTEKMPIIRKFAPSLYMAVRLGGMGVAIGTVVGEQIAQLVANDEE